MKLGELVDRFRVAANDKVEPYFNEDKDVIAWLNDAVDEACIRARLVHEHSNRDVCEIEVTTGSSQYQLHESLYEISFIAFDANDGSCARSVELVSPEYLDRCYYENWRSMIGRPRYAIQSETSIQLVPTPDQDGTLRLNGYRLPLSRMEALDDSPTDLHVAQHVHLIEWALHKSFSIPDTEFFDPNRSQIAEIKFENVFGIRPNSDMRRMTREDVPHCVVPFTF